MAIDKKEESRGGRTERLAALDAVTSNIEKQFGKGAIMRHRAWLRRSATRSNRRDLWPGVVR